MRKRYRRFFKLLTPYLLLLYLVLLTVSGAVYQSFWGTLKKEVEKSQLSMTAGTQKYWDGQLQTFTRIAYSISTNDKFTPHQLKNGGYDAYLAYKELVKLKAGNDILFDILYYPMQKNEADSLYSTSSTCEFSLFFHSIYQIEGVTPVQMKEYIQGITRPTILPMQKISYSATEETYLLYFYPLQSGNSTTSVVVFVIRNADLENQISSILAGNNGYVFILDKSRQMIANVSCGSHSVSARTMLDLALEKAVSGEAGSLKADGEDYILTSLVSPDSGWSYLVATDSRQFMEKVYSSRAFFNITLLTLAFLGTAGSFLIALRNYLPLHRLALSLRHKADEPAAGEAFDEIRFISQYIAGLSGENRYYEIRHTLWDMLLGKIMDRALAMEQAGYLPDCENFQVLLFFRDSSEPPEKESIDIHHSLEQIAIQSGIEKAFCFEYADDRSFPVLLCYNGQADSADIRTYIGNVGKCLENLITFTVGIGAAVSDLFQISKSMRQASAAIYYRVIRGKNSVIDYRETKTGRRDYEYPFACEQRLIGAIKLAKAEDIDGIMEQVASYIEKNADSPDAANSMCMGMSHAVIQTLEEIRIDTQPFVDDETCLYPQPYEPVRAFTARMGDVCKKICNFIYDRKESKNDELAKRAIGYIQEHFSDYTLSLDTIADHCSVSASYLSRFFKEQFCESIVQYISNLRMRRAKEMLSATDLTLREITLASGFGSETNFIRKFKKEEGITPIQFREFSRAAQGTFMK